MQQLLVALICLVGLAGAALGGATVTTWPDPFASPGVINAGQLQFSLNGWDCDAGALPTMPNGCQPAELAGKPFWSACVAGRNDCISSSTAFLGYANNGKVMRGKGFCYATQPATCRP